MDVYNPGFLTQEVSTGPLIGRSSLLNDLLEKLQKPTRKIAQRHFLIRSLSGMGKTALLREIRRYGLAKHETELDWFPLAFPEDHFQIDGLSDIWHQAIEAMEGHLQRMQSDQSLAAFRLKIATLAPEDPEAALRLLVESIQESGRLAVLLIDDIDDMLRMLESGHRSFFETLQSEYAFRVIGTCSFALEDSYLEQAASNRVFRMFDLESLNNLESLEFLQQVAKDSHRPDIASELNRDGNKARGLIELSGGNPRTLRLLFPLLEKENRDFPVRVLGEILDRITPWYKRRFQQLASLAQGILHLLALHREGLDLESITEQSGGDPNQYLAVLNELVDRRIVETWNPDDQPRPSFQIREKFFSVWCLMRNRNRSHPAFEWLVYFLEVFYDSLDRENMARKQLAIPATDTIGMHYGLAFARTIQKKPLALALQFSVIRACAKHDPSLQNAEYLINEHPVDRKMLESIHRLKDFSRLRQMINEAEPAQRVISPVFFEHLFGSPSLPEADKRKVGESADSLSPEKWLKLEFFLSHESDRWQSLLKHHASILYQAIASGLMAALDDSEGAEIAGELWQDPVIPAISHDARLNYTENPTQEELETIEAIYREAIRFDGQLPILWRNLSALQHAYFGNYNEAESSLRHAIALDPSQAPSWTSLGCLLKNLPNRLPDAESAYRKALSIEPRNPNSYNNLGWFLYQYRGRPEEANHLVHKALELDPDHLYSFHTLAALLAREDRWEEAVPYLRRFIEDCDVHFNRSAWKDVLSLFREIVRANKTPEAIAILDECSDSSPWKAVRKILAAEGPHHGFRIEEFPPSIHSDAKAFLSDPLDKTNR